MPAAVKARLDAIFAGQKATASRVDVLKNAKESDPVYRRLSERKLIRQEYDSGKIGIECPFASEHTTGDGDADAVYFLPHTNGYSTGNFHCLHKHCTGRSQKEYLKAIGLINDGEAEEDDPPQPGKLTEEEKISALYQGDDGSAALFIDKFKDRFCYDHAARRWFAFNGNSWEIDRKNRALASVSKIIPAYMREADRQAKLKHKAVIEENIAEAKKREELEKALLTRIKQLHNSKIKEGVLTMAAAGEHSLAITGEEWDTDPWLLGCPNGVVDLRTGDFRPGKPVDYIKTVTRAVWQGIDVPCPTWERFISEIFAGDAKVIRYIHTLLGYCLIGDTPLHIFTILWGQGRNGKGTMLETLKYVLHDYAYKAEAEILLAQKNAKSANSHNSAVLALRGKRIVWTSETNEGHEVNAAKVKEYAGGDTLSGRAPYGRDHVEFQPSHQLFLLTNYKPAVPAADYAIWQRIHLIPFEIAFVPEPRAANERLVDIGLPEKLKAEASGIVAWMVRGCQQYRAAGLVVPDKIKAAVKEYRDEENVIGAFINEVCAIRQAATIQAGALYTKYCEWCKANGYKAQRSNEFHTAMDRDERFDSYKQSRKKFYVGLALEAEEATETINV